MMDDRRFSDWRSADLTAVDRYKDAFKRSRHWWWITSVILSIAIGLAVTSLVLALSWLVLGSTLSDPQVEFPWVVHVYFGIILAYIFWHTSIHAVIVLDPLSEEISDWTLRRIGKHQRSFALTNYRFLFGQPLPRKVVESLASQIEANQCLEEFVFTAKHIESGTSIAPILEALATAGRLEVLIFATRGRMTDREIVALHNCLKGNRRLRALSLRFSVHFSSDLGAAIVAGLLGSDSLEYVNVSGANWEGISHDLCEAVHNMSHLRELRLIESRGIVMASLPETAIRHCPDLRVFRADVIGLRV